MMRLWGWFDDPDQKIASYDPPHDAPCPYCFVPVTPATVRTVAMMMHEGQYAKRSYYYRAHIACIDAEADFTMDGRILDAIEAAGD